MLPSRLPQECNIFLKNSPYLPCIISRLIPVFFRYSFRIDIDFEIYGTCKGFIIQATPPWEYRTKKLDKKIEIFQFLLPISYRLDDSNSWKFRINRFIISRSYVLELGRGQWTAPRMINVLQIIFVYSSFPIGKLIPDNTVDIGS